MCFTREEILFGFQKHLRIDAHSILRFDRGHRWDRADDHSQISFGAKLILLSLTIKWFGSPEINLSWRDFKLKKIARAQGEKR